MMTNNLCSIGSGSPKKVLLVALLSFVTLSCDGPSAPDVPTISMADKPMPKIVSATEAIRTPVIPKLDPATLDGAEVDKVLHDGPRCTFHYTAASPPILAGTLAGAAGNADGVIKINGRLVKLSSANSTSWQQLTSGAVFASDEIKVEIIPDSNKDTATERAAILHFNIEPDFHAGYKGWYRCDNLSDLAAAH